MNDLANLVQSVADCCSKLDRDELHLVQMRRSLDFGQYDTPVALIDERLSMLAEAIGSRIVAVFHDREPLFELGDSIVGSAHPLSPLQSASMAQQ